MPTPKKLPSTEYLRSLFNYSEGNLFWSVSRPPAIRAGRKAGKIRNGYVSIMIDGVAYSGHRLIYKFFNEDFDESKLIDHIDCNTTNNNIENLRLADKYQNMHNRDWPNRNKNTQEKGIDFLADKSVYRARVQYKGKRLIKSFKCLNEAKTWLREQRSLLHKEYTNHG